MRLTLYSLGTDFARIQDLLAASEGELTPEIDALLAGFDLAEPAKVDAYCRLIRNFYMRAAVKRATGKVFEDEAKRHKAAAQADENAAIRLESRLLEHLQRTDRRRIDTESFRVIRQRNGNPSVQCDCPEALPEPWGVTTTTVTHTVNRDAVLKAWRDGQALPAGVRIEVGEHLRIS